MRYIKKDMRATRREFLELMTLSMGSAGLAVPRVLAEPWRAVASRGGEPTLDRPPVVLPEYLRTLEKVLISIPADTMSYGATASHDGLGRGALSKFLDIVFRELLGALPEYSSVDIVARSDRRDFGLAVRRRAGPREARLHLVDAPGVEIELWAQDLGEPIFLDGRERFLVAETMSSRMGEQSKMSIDRKRVSELVFGEDAVLEADFAFEGGNLAFDARDGAARVFVGYNTVSRTVRARKLAGREISRRDVLAEVSATFGGAEVVEVGRETQSLRLQHIDQMFLILHDGVAVVSQLAGKGPGRESGQLRYCADQLRELGYRVFPLDHSAEDLASYRSSVNCVPFVDKTTGEKKILFPVFPGEVDPESRSLSRAALSGKGARAFDLYRELGYEPRPIRDVTHRLGGNTHCILNALA